MIKVIDYGLGNVGAFLNVFKTENISAEAASDKSELIGATHIILPGVGSFDMAMKLLSSSGMRETLEHLVIKMKIPILGVCVGMQMMANRSEEGTLPGLGWIDADVNHFESGARKENSKMIIPHMGWNDVKILRESPLFHELSVDEMFYFLHSYYFQCANEKDALASTMHGFTFVSAVQKQNIFGVQFHPEKSHHFGVRVLRNFASIAEC